MYARYSGRHRCAAVRRSETKFVDRLPLGVAATQDIGESGLGLRRGLEAARASRAPFVGTSALP
jgi:hypothetical protein